MARLKANGEMIVEMTVRDGKYRQVFRAMTSGWILVRRDAQYEGKWMTGHWTRHRRIRSNGTLVQEEVVAEFERWRLQLLEGRVSAGDITINRPKQTFLQFMEERIR